MNNFKKMFYYHWEGIDAEGEKVKSALYAPNVRIAKIQLYEQGIVIKKIVKKRPSLTNKINKKITPKDISFFSRQMSTLITSGISLIQAFEMIAKDHSNHRLKALLDHIKKDIETG